MRVSSTSAKLFSAGAYFYAFFFLRAAIFSYSAITPFSIILFQRSKLRPAVLGLLFPTMYNMTRMRLYKKIASRFLLSASATLTLTHPQTLTQTSNSSSCTNLPRTDHLSNLLSARSLLSHREHQRCCARRAMRAW